MTVWEAIVLGVVQGLTEFLPISSSAHLRVVGDLIGSVEPGAAFTAITQIGTELAVILYFRRDIARILSNWWLALRGHDGTTWPERTGSKNPDARLGWWIIIGTLPIVILGLLLEDRIDTSFRSLYIVAGTLAGFAILLGLADKLGRKERELTTMTGRHALSLGFAQAMALVPGVSRSGGTITIALALGYTRQAAARYSFLLAIPAVMGSGLYKLLSSWSELGTAGMPSLGVTAVATVVAFVVGYFVIIGFLRLISTRSFTPFVIYRIAAAVAILVLLNQGLVSR